MWSPFKKPIADNVDTQRKKLIAEFLEERERLNACEMFLFDHYPDSDFGSIPEGIIATVVAIHSESQRVGELLNALKPPGGMNYLERIDNFTRVNALMGWCLTKNCIEAIRNSRTYKFLDGLNQLTPTAL